MGPANYIRVRGHAKNASTDAVSSYVFFLCGQPLTEARILKVDFGNSRLIPWEVVQALAG